MPTATLKDTATTTITFDGFQIISRRIEAVNANPISFPENEGTEVIFLGQSRRVFILTKWKLKDDANYPGPGDSAADKRADLENLLFTGGDNEGLFILTFDSEDSVPGSPQTETYTVKYKLLHIRSEAGRITFIEGDLELWESI